MTPPRNTIIVRWAEPALTECMAARIAETAEAKDRHSWPDVLESTMFYYLGRGARLAECLAAHTAVYRRRMAYGGGL